MSYIVWTCSRNPRSYSSHQWWYSFSSHYEAIDFAERHPDCLSGEIPEVTQDPRMPPGSRGTCYDYPNEYTYRYFSGQIPWDLIEELVKDYQTKHSPPWGFSMWYLERSVLAMKQGQMEYAEHCLRVPLLRGEYPFYVEQFLAQHKEQPSHQDMPEWGLLRELVLHAEQGGSLPWGHFLHWISAACAAKFDGEMERAYRCLRVAWHADHKEDQEALFQESRLLDRHHDIVYGGFVAVDE